MSEQIETFLNNIEQEEARNSHFLHLTANEAYPSQAARKFMNSRLADRYYMGSGNSDGFVDLEVFTCLGLPSVSALVQSAEEAAKLMLKAKSVNLNCLSGVHAMMCAILVTTEPGDTVMTVAEDHGGHFATAGILKSIGRKNVFTSYDNKNITFDVDRISSDIKKYSVKALYLDTMYYLRPHTVKEIREAVGEDLIIIYDASHTMGLIMGQEFQSPLTEGANLISSNTHKSLPGPHKGMIAFRDQDLADKANTIINSCLYSTPHTQHLIALAVTLLEMKEFGRSYAKQVITNANYLGAALENIDLKVKHVDSNIYTYNHQIHLMTEPWGHYRDLCSKLVSNNIAVNFGDKKINNQDFIRIGTQEITRRGMKENQMTQIAEFLKASFESANIANQVIQFVEAYQKAHYSFDDCNF